MTVAITSGLLVMSPGVLRIRRSTRRGLCAAVHAATLVGVAVPEHHQRRPVAGLQDPGADTAGLHHLLAQVDPEQL